MTLDERLSNIEELLTMLMERQSIQEWYTTHEFARIVGRSEFTCRQWCRLGRIHAVKRRTGRGIHPSWAISHDELLRFQREGLLPLSIHN